jgi:prepilin-type N-terminal cleavage/methylation domain-containing protein
MTGQAAQISPRFIRLPSRRRRHGLTLIEVLATIVLMGIVLPAAMEGISQCVRAASISRQKSEAAGLAEAKLNELIATGDWEFGATTGDFGEAWPEYRWKAGTSEFTDPTLQQLSVQVFWTSRAEQRDVTLTTLVYQSQSSGTQ